MVAERLRKEYVDINGNRVKCEFCKSEDVARVNRTKDYKYQIYKCCECGKSFNVDDGKVNLFQDKILSKRAYFNSQFREKFFKFIHERSYDMSCEDVFIDTWICIYRSGEVKWFDHITPPIKKYLEINDTFNMKKEYSQNGSRITERTIYFIDDV